MKAGMYYNNSDVRIEELPVPEVSDNDILIKVMACGICGSDIMEWYRIKRAPLVLGHELAGEVIEAGKNITDFHPGDRVFSTHHVPCGECRYCKGNHETACETFQTINNHNPGGFSEQLLVSGKSLETGTYVLPDCLSYEQGTFIEPVGTAVRGVRAADIKEGDSVVVLGSGIAGLLIIKLATAKGANVVLATDISEKRLEAARNAGAKNTMLADSDIPAAILKANDGRLADKVIISAGALPAAKDAMQCADKGGVILFFAVPKPGETIDVDFNPYWRNDIIIKTCYGAAPEDNREAIELLSGGIIQVDDLVSHRYPLSEIADAFKAAADPHTGLKVIVLPSH